MYSAIMGKNGERRKKMISEGKSVAGLVMLARAVG
jgi:hypothetical protein